MLRTFLATCAFLIAASASAFAGGGMIHSGVRAHERGAVTKVGHRCRRDCDYRPSRAYDERRYYRSYDYRRYEYYRPPGHHLHRYDPGVVYYGPAGAYRPYPPVIVYDVPPPTFYYVYTREPFYHRVW